MTIREYALLTEEQQAALEPMARMLRQNGIEPRYMVMAPLPPGPSLSSDNRRWCQAKSRAYKKAEAERRRLRERESADRDQHR